MICFNEKGINLSSSSALTITLEDTVNELLFDVIITDKDCFGMPIAAQILMRKDEDEIIDEFETTMNSSNFMEEIQESIQEFLRVNKYIYKESVI